MGHFRGAAADIQSGAGEFLNAESGKSHASADDVDDRVNCTYFMKMDFLDRDIVDRGFRFAQFAENRGGTVFDRRATSFDLSKMSRIVVSERCLWVSSVVTLTWVADMPFFQTFSAEICHPGTSRLCSSERRRSSGDTRVDQGAKGHVAADAAETVEVGEFHECADLLEKMVQIDSIGRDTVRQTGREDR